MNRTPGLYSKAQTTVVVGHKLLAALDHDDYTGALTHAHSLVVAARQIRDEAWFAASDGDLFVGHRISGTTHAAAPDGNPRCGSHLGERMAELRSPFEGTPCKLGPCDRRLSEARRHAESGAFK